MVVTAGRSGDNGSFGDHMSCYGGMDASQTKKPGSEQLSYAHVVVC